MNAMARTAQKTGVLSARAGREAKHCSIARTPDIVGTKWALVLLREAVDGTTRVGDCAARR